MLANSLTNNSTNILARPTKKQDSYGSLYRFEFQLESNSLNTGDTLVMYAFITSSKTINTLLGY